MFLCFKVYIIDVMINITYMLNSSFMFLSCWTKGSMHIRLTLDCKQYLNVINFFLLLCDSYMKNFVVKYTSEQLSEDISKE